MDIARHVCYDKGQRYGSSFKGVEVAVCSIAVTLEGTIIHKSGLITGGKELTRTMDTDTSFISYKHNLYSTNTYLYYNSVPKQRSDHYM